MSVLAKDPRVKGMQHKGEPHTTHQPCRDTGNDAAAHPRVQWRRRQVVKGPEPTAEKPDPPP